MQKTKLWLIVAIILAVIVVSAAVVFLYANPQNSGSDGKSVTVIDDDGTEVTIKSVPQRIVSLAPGITEVLFAVGAGDQVVGVTDFCDYPYDFAEWIAEGKMSSIGSYWQPAIEPIIAIEPDLIIASGGGASDEAASKLRNMGYTVVVLNPQTIHDVLGNLVVVGKATGHADEAAAIVADLTTSIDNITNKVAGITDKPQVYVEISDEPLMSVGPTSYISDLVALAGGVSIFDDATTAYPVIGSEAVIAKNPDIILSSYTALNSFKNRPGWSSITAVTNTQIYNIGHDSTFSRPGPRSIDALDELSKIFHPEIFDTA